MQRNLLKDDSSSLPFFEDPCWILLNVWIVEKSARFEKPLALSTFSVGIHNSKNILTFSSVEVLQGASCQWFYFEIGVKDSVIYLESGKHHILALQQDRLCRKSKSLCDSTVCEEFSKTFGVTAWDLQYRSSAPHFLTKDLDHPFFKNGWNIFFIIYLIIYIYPLY